MLAYVVMDHASVLLNDKSKAIFTYDIQLPYLNIALVELEEELELNNVPITNRTDALVVVNPGIDGIGGGNGQPNLPPYLVEPITLYEKPFGTAHSFSEMKRVEFLPVNQINTAYLIYWSWVGDRIHFIPGGATSQLTIQMNYVRSVFKHVATDRDEIQYNRARSYLVYRTAALCAEFVGENKTRSDELNGFAGLALQRTLGIVTKGRQAITTRRKPFMSSWKSRRIV